MSVRLIAAPISILFEEESARSEEFEREYHTLSESDDDPIGQWLKIAKARGETSDSDSVVLNLLVELHRKMDNLERLIKNEKPKRLELSHEAMIESIGFHHFKLQSPLLKEGMRYYGRILMPVYPKRDVGIFFETETNDLAKIVKMHERDEKEWAQYFTARERVMIREMRGK